jgi:hypothetical protein
MPLLLFVFSLGIIGTIVFWPRKPKPIEYEEREFLNGKLLVPKD